RLHIETGHIAIQVADVELAIGSEGQVVGVRIPWTMQGSQELSGRFVKTPHFAQMKPVRIEMAIRTEGEPAESTGRVIRTRKYVHESTRLSIVLYDTLRGAIKHTGIEMPIRAESKGNEATQ